MKRVAAGDAGVGWLARLCLAGMVCALFAVFTPSVSAVVCDGTALDDGCLFTVTGGDTPDPDDGFAVTNAADVPLWDFVQARDLDGLGFPISQRWTDGPFTLQAFQKVILQWDPARRRMNYFNTLDALANRYPEVELPFMPAHQVLAADQGVGFGTVTRNHLALLEQNTAIQQRFLAEPDWLNLYGLPIRYEEREVDGNPQGVQLLRTQRTVFAVWNVPAPGTTIGRVLLQNTPDQVKQLSGVIIPDWAKAPLDEHGREVPTTPETATIYALPWAADGVTPLEREAIARLQTIATASPDLFWYLMRDLELPPLADLGDDPVRAQPTALTLRTYDLLIDIARLAWVQDGLSRMERETSQDLYSNAFLWPEYVQALLQKTWLRHGLSRSEYAVTKQLHLLLNHTVGLRPWESPSSRRQKAAKVGVDILAMPFLETIEGFEHSILHQLQSVYGFLDFTALPGAIDHLVTNGWLTDQQAIRLLYSGLSAPHYSAPNAESYIADIHSPEQLDPYLLAGVSGLSFHHRQISTPYSENLDLYIAGDLPVSPQSMVAFEEIVRDLEHTIGVAFPYRSAIILVGRDFYTAFSFNHVRLKVTDSFHFDDQGVVLRKSRVLVHEMGHYYFHAASQWVYEGSVLFLTALILNRLSTEAPLWNTSCPTDKIVDIVRGGRLFGPEGRSEGTGLCPYHLGADLFLDLYHSLGHTFFFQGFRRLHLATIDDYVVTKGFIGYRYDSCEGANPGLYYVRRAFVTEAPPEAAAIAEPIIQHRYYVGDR